MIDGAGCFKITKKDHASLDIVMKMTDKHCLFQIKQKFGGSVKLRSGINWLRYRVHHKKGLLDLINSVNGEIRNPIRLLEFNKICEKYSIPLIQASELTYYNGWLSGFFDSIGSINLDQDSTNSKNLLFTLPHRNNLLLTLLKELYGGSLEVSKEKYTWIVNKTHEIKELLDYFNKCPSRSSKHIQLKAIKKYLELKYLKANLAGPNTILGKTWSKFLIKFNSRSYSTSNVKQLTPLNPYWITGFSDAEGCFSISFKKTKSSKVGYYIRPSFIIHLDAKDYSLLEKIKLYFGVGYISKGDKNTFYYGVSSLSDLNEIIIPHFLKYHLITQKQIDFKLFKHVIDLINLKEHLTLEGIIKIVSIRSSINKGLSETLKIDFPDVKPFPKPLYEFSPVDPNWIVGFVDGEANFSIDIYKDKTKTGFTSKLTFQITQHKRDTILIERFLELFDCGIIKTVEETAIRFIVTKFNDIDLIIIPFFKKFSLEGTKLLNFEDFCKAAEIMRSKGHLTLDGLENIKKIKAGMNTGREN